ncbi:MAG: hypothetical protein V4649_14160 [Bacteroidota bacterium]
MDQVQIKRLLSTLAILVALAWPATCPAQVEDSAAIVGALTKCWRAFSHEYATIYGLEEEEIKTYSKQKVCLKRDSISLYYGVSYAPKYSIKKVHAENYSKTNFDCSKRNLGILADSMYEVTISSLTRPSKNGTVNKMTTVLAYDSQCIYIVVDGVVFKLLDADTKIQPRSSN